MAQNRKKRVKVLATMISALVALLILEAGLQVYYRLTVHSWLWAYNAFHVTFIDEVADRRQYALRKGFSDSRIGVTINFTGFRAPAEWNEPGRETPVIAALGDSKSFGSGVGDKETYAYLLDRLLAQDGSQMRVVNAGVPSYNTRQAIDRFRIDVLPNYDVKTVVFHAAFNDISLLTYYRDKWDPDKTWADIRYKGFKPPLPVIQRLATFYFLTKLLTARTDESPVDRSKDVTYALYPDDAMIANLRAELNDFLTDCEARSISVVLLPIDPFYYQTANADRNENLFLWSQNRQYVDAWRGTIGHYDELLAEMARTHRNVYFLDTRRAMDENDRDKIFVDAVHYSATGNKIVAESLAALLKKEHILDQR
jgi:hypothetical protein